MADRRHPSECPDRSDCNICSHCFIENDVIVGDRVTIKSGVQLWDGIRIEDDVFIGPNVSFTNDKKPMSGNRVFSILSTLVQRKASIGAGSVFFPGITIGARAVAGAGAVVTKDVPPGATVVGNPARELRKRKRAVRAGSRQPPPEGPRD